MASFGMTGGVSSLANLGAADAGTTNGVTAVTSGAGLTRPWPVARAETGLASSDADSGAAKGLPDKGLYGLTPVMALTSAGGVDVLAAWASRTSGSTAGVKTVGVVLSCRGLVLPSTAMSLVLAALALVVLGGNKVLTAVWPLWACTCTFRPF